MKLGLCMIVRDEEPNIEECVGPIIDCFDDVVVVDTGSRDRTLTLLRRLTGKEPLVWPIDQETWFNKYQARNLAFKSVQAEWIFSMDADERISPAEIPALRAVIDSAVADGFFVPWTTHGANSTVEDYKLCAFRKGYQSRGLVHENVQHSLREAGARAIWTEAVDLRHFPDAGKLEFKRRFYIERLRGAIRQEPQWWRYHWFLGYSLFRTGSLNEAETYLRVAAESQAREFPVECLNAHMVWAEIVARQGESAECRRVICAAQGFLSKVSEDFEVIVNFRLGAWFEAALLYCERGQLDLIRAYEFSA